MAKRPYYKKGRRIGRGVGSGRGKTSGKGHKGQKARSGSGARIRPGFEGGQTPLYRRLPKRGFNNAAFRKSFSIINLDRIEKLNLPEISPEILITHGELKPSYIGLKVLGDGDIKRAVTVKAHRFSQAAKQKIEQAGGQVVLIEENKDPK